MEMMLLHRLLPLFLGWIGDRIWGDPSSLPHPVVGFGKWIAWGEKRWNKGSCKILKGGLLAVVSIVLSFSFMCAALYGLFIIHPVLYIAFSGIILFFCLAGTTLIREVKQVFIAVDSSVEEGRKQVARIVGRDTSNLNPLQIRTAALETLAENLSDGVIAPLFWWMILGVPGMFAYKMINTLDSMIGYKNERYKQFGCWAAHIDDWANYIPARLTAVLMIIASGKWSVFSFVKKYGKNHTSPNSGYPEAALAGILNCRFGGPNVYFGQTVHKLYIGNHPRELTFKDLEQSVEINKKTELLMLVIITLVTVLAYEILCNWHK
jgi:adenosylcobinamide-phosphate synthase